MIVGPSDPTQAGFAPPAEPATRLSASECDALCTKAARGAGLTWGLAQEAGFAARWFHVRGIDGPRLLLSLIEVLDGLATPRLRGCDISAERDLSPITVGALLSDLAGSAEARFDVARLRVPALVVPFLHQVCRVQSSPARLSWAACALTVFPDGSMSGDIETLLQEPCVDVSITHGGGPPDDSMPTGSVATTDADVIAALDAYAMRTTVPATAGSRADAGAAIDDND